MIEIEYRGPSNPARVFQTVCKHRGWMQIMNISEADLQKVFENTWYWITAYQDKK